MDEKSRLVGDINDTKQEKPDFAWCIATKSRSHDYVEKKKKKKMPTTWLTKEEMISYDLVGG